MIAVHRIGLFHTHNTSKNDCLHWLITFIGKISAQPHPTLCIQFLNRGNNDKNNTFPLGKQICFTIVWGCAETLPVHLIFM